MKTSPTLFHSMTNVNLMTSCSMLVHMMGLPGANANLPMLFHGRQFGWSLPMMQFNATFSIFQCCAKKVR